jgi:16S rRNA (uracil1498-N3)-methyltransferase
MARYDFRSPRLFVDQPLQGGLIALDQPQAHYLRDVLRLKPGDRVLVFNGREGEWHGTLDTGGKRTVVVRLEAQTRPQEGGGDLHYLFAPLKRARLDYVVQKAVEMGVARLVPAITRHTQAERVNVARMRANAIEAAEQCGVLRLPEIAEPVALADALGALAPERLLIFCDEDAPIADPAAALAAAAGAKAPVKAPTLALAVLVGPEGGFAAEEREMLLARRNIVRLALGPRILRADTAAVAALALVQAVLGDWRGSA